MTFWKRTDRIEQELRSNRPEPRPEFLDRIVGRIEGHGSRLRSFRVAVAVGLIVTGLAVLGAFGGLGYAASTVEAVKAPVLIIKKIVKPSKAKKASARQTSQASDKKPSDNQYKNKVTICHIPKGNEDNPQTLTLSESGARAHLSQHVPPEWPGDHEGPCTTGKKGGGNRR
jgi:hypothetical protein